MKPILSKCVGKKLGPKSGIYGPSDHVVLKPHLKADFFIPFSNAHYIMMIQFSFQKKYG